ncbi:tPR repeat-containing protein [Prevotella sp. CAG:1320]|nr:tPR repeat-containing protein [Prevotella sp. CAG:1320]
MFKNGLAVFMWIVVLLSSCGGSETDEWAHPTLYEADSLVEDAPEKALSLLRKDSAAICGQGKAGVMGLWLLKIHAEDKLYVTHLSDSIMQEVVEYYDAHGTPAQRAHAHYVLGRVYCDMRLSGSAISAFEKAIETRGEDNVTYLYKYKAASWLGALYEGKRLWKDAMAAEKEAYGYAQKSGRTAPVVYALRDIGRLYDYQGKGKLGIPYYRKASAIALKARNAYLYNMVEEELAGVYIENGMMAEARKSLSTPVVEGTGVAADIASRYYIWGFFYERNSMPDSALYFYKISLPYGDIRFKHEVYADIASLYRRMGNYAESSSYSALYEATADSLKRMEVAEDENLLDYVEESLSANKEKMKVMRQRTKLAIIVAILVLILVPLGAYTLYAFRKRKIERQLQHERLKAYRGKVNDSRKRDKEELSALRERLNNSSHALTDMQRELLQTTERLFAKEEETRVLRKRQQELKTTELQRSECYGKFHDDKFLPALKDFVELQQVLDDTYDNFTSKLKELIPAIREEEMWVCCMIKMGMTPVRMCKVLSCKPNYLSMMRKRLYKKIFHQEGSATDFDAFIKDL